MSKTPEIPSVTLMPTKMQFNSDDAVELQPGRQSNVTKFNHYVKNVDTILLQRDYEENEAVSNLLFKSMLTATSKERQPPV